MNNEHEMEIRMIQEEVLRDSSGIHKSDVYLEVRFGPQSLLLPCMPSIGP